MAYEVIATLDEYYKAYPDSERIGSDCLEAEFNRFVAFHSIQVVVADEDPAVGLVNLSYRPLPPA